jgi:hypothetical protein
MFAMNNTLARAQYVVQFFVADSSSGVRYAQNLGALLMCVLSFRADRSTLIAADYLSSDHDPLHRFHQWQANLRILDVEAIKTVPYAPLSHSFVERLIGTIRRECLDRTVFWTAADLETKLFDFQRDFKGHRTHAGLGARTPEPCTDEDSARASVSKYRWRPHCRGLYQKPIAA